MTLKAGIITIFGFFLLLSTPAIADETSPANLSNACAGCHGGDGAIPSLDGLSSAEIAELMRSLKNDSVLVTVMNRIAKGYTDKEIDAIANYLGGQ